MLRTTLSPLLPALLLTLSFTAAQASTETPMTTLTVTNLGAKSLSSRVPIVRRYDELTPEQQASIRADYDQLATDDEPPFPKDGLKWQYSQLMKLAEIARLDGELMIVVTVDSAGVPTKAVAYKSPDKLLAQNMSQLLMQDTYKPGKCHGQACKMDYLFDVRLSDH